MNENPLWDKWLNEADSNNALAPEDYDDDASDARARELHERLTAALTPYQVKSLSPSVFQDGTGLTQSWILPSTADPRFVESALASVMLSHFGELATIRDCKDPELFAKLRRVLDELKFKFIELEYIASRIYRGKCASLRGVTWDERYFSVAPQYTH